MSNALAALQAELAEKHAELIEFESNRSPIQPSSLLAHFQTNPVHSSPLEFEITKAAREQRVRAIRHEGRQNRIVQGQADLQEIKQCNEKLQQELKTVVEREHQANLELNELRARSQLLEASPLKHRAQLLQLQTLNSQLQRENEQLEGEIAHLSGSISQAESVNSQLLSDNAQLAADNAKLAAESASSGRASTWPSTSVDYSNGANSTAVRLEQLEHDNMRLCELLFAHPEYAEFSEFSSDHADGIAYVGGQPELERKFLFGRYMKDSRPTTKVDPGKEAQNWVPRLAYDAAEHFRRLHMMSVDPKLIQHLVWRLARVLWRSVQLEAKLSQKKLTAKVNELQRRVKQREAPSVLQPRSGAKQVRRGCGAPVAAVAEKTAQAWQRILTATVKKLSGEVSRLIEMSESNSITGSRNSPDEPYQLHWGRATVQEVDKLGESVLQHTTQLRQQVDRALVGSDLSHQAACQILSDQSMFFQQLDDSMLECRCAVAALFGM